MIWQKTELLNCQKIIHTLDLVLDKNQDDVLEEFINVFSEKDQYYAFIKAIFKKVKKDNQCY